MGASQAKLVTAAGSASRTIDVAIVAEVRLYREGLAHAISQSGRARVVATASSCEDLEAQLGVVDADVVLVDVSAVAGDELIAAVRRLAPRTRIAAFGIGETESEVLACAEAGLHGYVAREATLDDLLATLEGLVRDELPCSPRIAATLMRRVAALSAERRVDESGALTRREAEVLELIAEGLSNKEIASRLRIELPTVKNHVHSILEKLNVHRRADAAARLRRASLGISG